MNSSIDANECTNFPTLTNVFSFLVLFLIVWIVQRHLSRPTRSSEDKDRKIRALKFTQLGMQAMRSEEQMINHSLLRHVLANQLRLHLYDYTSCKHTDSSTRSKWHTQWCIWIKCHTLEVTQSKDCVISFTWSTEDQYVSHARNTCWTLLDATNNRLVQIHISAGVEKHGLQYAIPSLNAPRHMFCSTPINGLMQNKTRFEMLWEISSHIFGLHTFT